MKLHLALFCLCTIISHSAFGAETETVNEPELYSTEIDPEVGDYFVYTYRKYRAQTGKPAERGEGPVRIEIQEVNDQGVEFTYRQIVEIPMGLEGTPMAEVLQASDYTLRLHADPAWELIEIVNFDEIHKKLIRIAELSSEVASVGLTPEEKERTKAAMVSMFQDRQIAYSIAYKQVGLFFLGAGWTGYEGQERTIESELPNPLGGPPLPALIGISLHQDEDLGTTQLDYTQRFDPELVSDALKSIVTRMTQRMGIEDPELEWDPEDLYMLDKAVYIVDLRTQFLSTVEFKRNIRMNGLGKFSGEHKEEYSWTLIEHGVIDNEP